MSDLPFQIPFAGGATRRQMIAGGALILILPPPNLADAETPAVFEHLVSNGQSLMEGDEAEPILTTAPIPGAVKFARGIGTWSLDDHPSDPGKRDAASFALVPMLPDTDKSYTTRGVENMMVTLTSLRRLQPGAPANVLGTYAGQGGRRLSDLSSEDRLHKGYFKTLLDDFNRAKIAAGPAKYFVGGYFWDQGQREGDLKIYEDKPVTTFQAVRDAWAKNFMVHVTQMRAAVTGITGQPSVPVFINQVTGGPVSVAQLMVIDKMPGVFLCGPTYAVPHAENSRRAYDPLKQTYNVRGDSIHLSADGQRWMGCQAAKVLQRVNSGVPWKGLRPAGTSARRMDSLNIEVDFHVPVPPLVLDTGFFPKANGWGFSAYDDSAPGTTANRIGVIEAIVTNDARAKKIGTVRFRLASPIGIGRGIFRGAFDGSFDSAANFEVTTTVAGPVVFGQPTTLIHLAAGADRGVLAAASAEGCFYAWLLKGTGPSRLLIDAVSITRGNVSLRVENRHMAAKLQPGAMYAAGRSAPYTNLRDSDGEITALTFGDFFGGARRGTAYPLWNWCACFELPVKV